MTDVNELISAALAGLPCPATRTPAVGACDQYVTWHVLMSTPTAYASNQPRRMEHMVQIDIYSRIHYAELLSRLLVTLRESDLALQSVAAEDYEPTTRYHHLPVTVRLTQAMDDN